jgi:hypothetical protein
VDDAYFFPPFFNLSTLNYDVSFSIAFSHNFFVETKNVKTTKNLIRLIATSRRTRLRGQTFGPTSARFLWFCPSDLSRVAEPTTVTDVFQILLTLTRFGLSVPVTTHAGTFPRDRRWS